jgi:hypothetical protein
MGAAPIDVMLLSWDFECTNGDVTMTSQDLLEEVKYPLQMASIIDDRLNLKNPVISGLFEPRQIEPASGMPAAPMTAMPTALPPTAPFAPAGSAGLAGDAAMPPSISPMGVPHAHAYAPAAPFHGAKRKALTEAEMAQERISTILSLNGAGGWIRDVEYNNFYFFYTDIVNKKPEELTVGMTLQFRLRYDKIKTEQKDGEPSYRAIGPIYAVD